MYATCFAGWPATPSHSYMFTTSKYSFLNSALYEGNHGWNHLEVSGVRIDARIVRGERLHLIEAVRDWVGLGLVAEMPLARKIRRVAVLLEEFGNGGRLLAQRILVTRATTMES